MPSDVNSVIHLHKSSLLDFFCKEIEPDQHRLRGSTSPLLGGGTMQTSTPDTLFPGTDDAWDPFREMRDLQAQMDKMFQRSISRFQLSPLMDPFKNDTGKASMPLAAADQTQASMGLF